MRDIKIGVVYISPAANREETEKCLNIINTRAWEGYHLWRLECPSQEVGQSLQQARKPTSAMGNYKKLGNSPLGGVQLQNKTIQK